MRRVDLSRSLAREASLEPIEVNGLGLTTDRVAGRMVLGALREGVQSEKGGVVREALEWPPRVLPVRIHELAGDPLSLGRRAGRLCADENGTEQEHRDVLGRVGEAEPIDVNNGNIGPVHEHVGGRVLAVRGDESNALGGRQGAEPL